eukprot:1991625-Pleurochrysis_carterae.AAC.2
MQVEQRDSSVWRRHGARSNVQGDPAQIRMCTVRVRVVPCSRTRSLSMQFVGCWELSDAHPVALEAAHPESSARVRARVRVREEILRHIGER